MSASSQLAVMVVGAAGRMGRLTAQTVDEQSDMRVVALVDPSFGRSGSPSADSDEPATAHGASQFESVAAALTKVRPQVAVDFTVPSVVRTTARAVLQAGVDLVIGTTGLSDEDVATLDEVRRGAGAHLFIAPNFALGAVLLMRFAEQAARHYGAAEIIESHHAAKVDAPSGTALRTASLMRKAAGVDAPSPQQLPQARGALADGYRVHSVRLPGLVAHQEVLFGGAGEVLTLRHDAVSREAFMPGVLLALRHVGELPGTVVGLEHLLG